MVIPVGICKANGLGLRAHLGSVDSGAAIKGSARLTLEYKYRHTVQKIYEECVL
jgi:hypothetical protein